MIQRLFVISVITVILVPAWPGRAVARQSINDVYAILFIMDGLNIERFNDALVSGRIPTIQKYFVDEGAFFSRALTVFPSASSTAYPSFVSGLFPGHSGVVYLGWFDRTERRPIDYFSPLDRRRMDTDFLNLRALLDPNESDLYPPSTIFDYLSDYETATIYSSFNGTSRHIYPSIPLAAGWAVFGSAREEMLDQYAIRDLNRLFDRPIDDIPRFSFVGLYSFDSLGHHFGPQTDMLDYNMERFDRLLADLIRKLKDRGLFDKTYIILAADHGMHATPRGVLHLNRSLKGWGLTPYPGRPRQPEFNVHLSVRGVTTAHLYFKGSGEWTARPTYEELRNYPLNNGKTIDVIERLRGLSGVQLTVVRDGFNRVRVFSETCEGVITVNGDRYRYDVPAGVCDPLRMNESGARHLVSRGFFDERQWGEKTVDHVYPDAVVQLSQIFADGRSGDIFIIPGNDWVFCREKAASHGSIISEDMRIPFLLRGPTVPAGLFGFMRAPDLYPTMLDWFGIRGNPDHYDGQHLFRKAGGARKKISKEKSKKRLEAAYRRLLENDDGNPARNANLWLIQQQIERLSE